MDADPSTVGFRSVVVMGVERVNDDDRDNDDDDERRSKV